MAIYFRDRKNQTTLDASFYLYDGAEISDMDRWHVGDKVQVLIEVSSEMNDAIRELACDAWGINCYTGAVYVECIVAERSHACAYRGDGKFQELMTGVTLEAATGPW